MHLNLKKHSESSVSHMCKNMIQSAEWAEFTPYEVGLLKYGIYIRTEDFGSEYFMGRLMKRIPESRFCYLQGDVFLIYY